MTITAKVLADTYNTYNGARLTTLELYYPRFIHSEIMTYRMWSRNASSSRAIPVATLLKSLANDPAMPVHWGAKQKGMQAFDECNSLIKDPFLGDMITREEAWGRARGYQMGYAAAFDEAGYAKQIVNRRIENDGHIRVVVTATEYNNMFAQRLHPDAQPEFQELAKQIKAAMLGSNPVNFSQQYEDDLGEHYHHLPYITADDRAFIKEWAATAWPDWEAAEKAKYQDDEHFYAWTLMKVCAARCARVSYHLHDGRTPDIMDDLRLADQLIESGHWSPFEHACTPCGCPNYHYNLRGFVNFRHMLDQWFSALRQRESALSNAGMIASLVGGEVVDGPDGEPFVVQSSETKPKGRTLN